MKGNGLARAIAMQAERSGRTAPVFEFGEILEDYSLLTNSFPIPIPRTDYLVCRQLTLGDTGARLTETAADGVHHHGTSGTHGGHWDGDGGHDHTGEGPHIHEVRIPEPMRRLKPGDRVVVAWVGDDAVVVDLFFPAAVLL